MGYQANFTVCVTPSEFFLGEGFLYGEVKILTTYVINDWLSNQNISLCLFCVFNRSHVNVESCIYTIAIKLSIF